MGGDLLNITESCWSEIGGGDGDGCHRLINTSHCLTNMVSYSQLTLNTPAVLHPLSRRESALAGGGVWLSDLLVRGRSLCFQNPLKPKLWHLYRGGKYVVDHGAGEQLFDRSLEMH